MTKIQEASKRLIECGIRPSSQRVAIMNYVLTHFTHPTVEDVFNDLRPNMPNLSRTTVYNSLRLFSEHNAVQMITIDDHHMCFDGNVEPHVHFICKKCGHVYDLFSEEAPTNFITREVDGHLIESQQLYYKGICKYCRNLS